MIAILVKMGDICRYKINKNMYRNLTIGREI